MKKMMTFCLLLVAAAGFSQNLTDIRLNKLYTGPLTSVLDDISRQHGVHFSYEKPLLENVQIAERPFDEPLGGFLKKALKGANLKFYEDAAGNIHILGEFDKADAQALAQPKKYAGAPTRLNLTVVGKITDKLSGESLPFVTIQVAGASIGGDSNVDGLFTLLNVPADTNTLVFRYIGYDPTTIFLSPEANLENLLVEMTPTSTQLDEVLVVAEREALMQAGNEVSMLKMTPAKIASLPSLGEKDIFRAFQLMPGISAANEHTSGLYVRGGTPDQALTLYDGFTVYNVDHLFGFYSAFNANAIKDVQLYKGAFGAKHGGRLSSVVELTGKEGNNRRFNLGGDLSLLSINLFAEAPIGEKLTSIVAVRRSWKSPIYNEIFDRFSGENETPLPSQFGNTTKSWFYDLNAKLTWKPTNHDVFALSFYNGKDNLDNSIRPELPGFLASDANFSLDIADVTDWGNTGASLKWSRKWGSRLYSNTLVSYSKYFSDRDRSVAGSFTNADGETESIRRGAIEVSDLYDYSAKSDFEWAVSQNHQAGFGFFYTWNDIAYRFSQNDTSSVIDRQTKGSTLGAYLQDEWQTLGDRLTLTPGLRFSYFSETGKPYMEPRFSFSYQLTDEWKLKGSAGRYFQFAKRVIREDVLQGSRDFWVLADDDRLPVSSNRQFVFGASYETNGWLFDAEAYHKKLEGLSEYSLRFSPSFGNIDYDEFYYEGNGTARGIDFLVQKKYGRWNGWAGYTIGDVRQNFEVYGEQDFYASNDVTHEFKLVNLYKWRNWEFSATWIFASGKPYTASDGGYQLTLLDGTVQDYLSVSAKNGLRLPAYHRLDLAATLHFGVQSKSSIAFSLFNVYNRNNVWYKTFEIVDDTVIGTDVNYLGITPNLTFTTKIR
jgi:hypothetical protein